MSHQTNSNSQSTVKLNVTQKPVCKGGYHFKLKLMTAIVFACACLIQNSSNSISILESSSPIHQQSLQASESKNNREDTCSGIFRPCRFPGGGSMSEYSKKDEV